MSMPSLAPAAVLAADPQPAAGSTQLLVAALLGIAVIVALITQLKLHPFLSLTIGSFVVAAVAGEDLGSAVDSFTAGFGDTAAGVGTLIALGAMFGKLLADSGGADQIVDTIVDRSSVRTLPWAMVLVGALIGLPMFFEIGLVLLMPVILLVSRRSGLSLLSVGIPTLAGLSVMHGLVPPHPGPLIAVQALGANLGLTLGLGVLVAIPTVVLAGPVFGRYAARWVDVPAPELYDQPEKREHRPTFATTLATVLLPVVLMMGKAVADVVVDDADAPVQKVIDVVGNPLVALLLGRPGRHGDLRARGPHVATGAHPVGGVGPARHRRHPAHRVRRWRLQADPRRHRHRPGGRGLGRRQRAVGAAAGLARRGVHPAGHRLGHGGDGDRLGHPGRAARRAAGHR